MVAHLWKRGYLRARIQECSTYTETDMGQYVGNRPFTNTLREVTKTVS